MTHNSMHSIKKTLDSLLEFTRADFKLYVVDNSSTDGTPEFIEQNYPQLEL
ncbi:MAG: glycosyltransferase, partial [Clostridiales bacterium]